MNGVLRNSTQVFTVYSKRNSIFKEIKEISDLEESERKRRIRSDEKNIEENKKHREVVNEEIKKLVTEIETQVKEDKTEHPPHEEVRKTYS